MPVACKCNSLIFAVTKPRKPHVKVVRGDVEEQAAEEAESGVAEIAMQKRHRARLNAGEPITHDKVGTAP